MIPSSLYCPSCGAANATDRSLCFACNQSLQTIISDNTTLLQGRYRILTQVGKGGFGAVYRAEDTRKYGDSVAVKQINLRGLTPQETIEATDAFNREVSLLSNLSHPNLPHIYDNFTDPEHWYLVMDFIEGETLETYLEAKGANYTASLNEVLTLGIQLCTVLDYLHTREPVIIFRDLKPANIMRTPTGKLYLIDFGIARSFKPGKLKDTIPFGSPGYAAPEQYGKAQTTPRADIYSLGALLHMLLTGNDPVDNPFHFAPLRIYSVAGLTDLDALISRMVQIDANGRPATIMEVKDELQRIANMQASPRLWHPPIGQTPPAFPAIGSGQQQISTSSTGQQQLYVPSAQRKSLARRKFLVGGFAITGLTIIGASGIANIVSALHGSTNVWHEPSIGAPQFNNGSLFGNIYAYMGHTQPVQDVVWSQDNNVLASVSGDGTVQVWAKDRAIASGTSTSNNPYIFDTIETATCLAWGKGANEKLLAYDSGQTITIVEPPSYILTILAPASSEVSSDINTFAWSPDGNFIVLPTHTGVQIWHVTPGKMVKRIDFLTNQTRTKASITSLSWSSDGKYVAAGTTRDEITIIDVSQESVKMSLEAAGGTYVAWSPDNTSLAAVSGQIVAVSFTSDDYRSPRYYSLPNDVTALAWSYDSQYLVAASQDDKQDNYVNISVWNIHEDDTTGPGGRADRSNSITFDMHGVDIHSLAWSPDEKYIAIGADKAYLLEINPAMLNNSGQQGFNYRHGRHNGHSTP